MINEFVTKVNVSFFVENEWIVKEILKHEPVSNNQHRYPAIRFNIFAQMQQKVFSLLSASPSAEYLFSTFTK
mgnify:CR=1 FL=1